MRTPLILVPSGSSTPSVVAMIGPRGVWKRPRILNGSLVEERRVEDFGIRLVKDDTPICSVVHAGRSYWG